MRRGNKYKAVKTVVDGVTFHSQREASYYSILRQKEMCGLISDLELQPRFPIVMDGRQVRYPGSNRPMTYVADFAFKEKGEKHVLDVKGIDTPVSKIKRALVEHIYRIKIEVVK